MKLLQNNRVKAYNEILDKIKYCEWEPGMLISETKLSDMFGISRTPIREILSLLAREGFVDIVPQKGTYVSLIDLNRIQDILFLRYHLEMPILEQLSEQQAELPTEIEKLTLLMNFEIGRENWREAVELDYRIHEVLITMSGHEHIWDIIKVELPHYTRFRFFEPNHLEFKGDIPRVLKEHSVIIESIHLGDTKKLREIMRSHYDYTFALRKAYNADRISRHPDYFIKDQYEKFMSEK